MQGKMKESLTAKMAARHECKIAYSWRALAFACPTADPSAGMSERPRGRALKNNDLGADNGE